MKYHIDRLGYDVTIPRGWRRVTRGKARKEDMAFRINCKRFTPLESVNIGVKAIHLWCLIRKERK